MALEYSVGYNQLIFLVNIPATTQAVVFETFLTPSQKNELKNFQVMDGYIFAPNIFFIAHKVNGDEEPFQPGSYAFFPFVDWHKKVFIRSPNAQIVRVKFVVDFPRH